MKGALRLKEAGQEIHHLVLAMFSCSLGYRKSETEANDVKKKMLEISKRINST